LKAIGAPFCPHGSARARGSARVISYYLGYIREKSQLNDIDPRGSARPRGHHSFNIKPKTLVMALRSTLVR
jgi:hypothetical protein